MEVFAKISRVQRSKEEAKANYNRISKWYDILAGFAEKKYRDAGLQKLCAREGERILEIGFGTGYCLLSLAESVGDSGMVYGIDISEGMYNVALSRIKKAGLSDRVRLVCGDAAQFPFEANKFDAIFMSFTLELFDTPEISTVLQQCKRIIRTGGRICVVSLSKKQKDGIMIKLYEWLHRKFPNFLDCRPIFVLKALKDAGFQETDVTEKSMWGLPVEIVLAKKV